MTWAKYDRDGAGSLKEKEAATILQMTPEEVNALCQEGKLARVPTPGDALGMMPSGHFLIHHSSLNAFIWKRWTQEGRILRIRIWTKDEESQVAASNGLAAAVETWDATEKPGIDLGETVYSFPDCSQGYRAGLWLREAEDTGKICKFEMRTFSLAREQSMEATQ